MNKNRRIVGSLLSIALSTASIPAAKAWHLNSENKKTGVNSYASEFWVEGKGPITYEKFFGSKFDEGTPWATLTISCVQKTLAVTIAMNKAGSENLPISLDDPGSLAISLDNALPRKYKTNGTDLDGVITIKDDASRLIKAFYAKRTASINLRELFTNKTFKLKFNVKGLTTAKSRFKTAGCSI